MALIMSPSGSPAATICKGTRLALVIGNKSYPDIETPLKGPGQGAEQIAGALRAMGFDVEVGEDLTKAKTDAAVRVLAAKIKPGAAIFLFFSGFGVQAGGHTYLLPVDASIWSEADILASGLNIDHLLTEIDEKKAAVGVLVIDAARRNPFERRFRTTGSAGLAPPSAISGNLVALYSAPPNKVFDAADLSAEAFANDVAREITAPHATAQEAFRQVRTVVARTSRAGQTPWGFTTLNDDLPLDVHDCSVSPAEPAPPPRPQTAQVEPTKPGAERPAADIAKAPAPAPAAPQPPAPAAVASPPPATPIPEAPKEAAKLDPPAAPPAPTPPPSEHPTTAAQPAPPTPAPDDKAQRFQVELQDAPLLAEVRDLLFEQNLDPGPPGSDTMRKAIRTFEQQAGLPDSGRPTLGLLDALRATPDLKPWGAITVASDVKSWGMSWDKSTRTQALAEAKSRCGTQRCTEEMTFHGPGCGAFALSPRHWIVAHRDGGEAARKAALSDCSKPGAACRVIGSVCANGSDKTN